MGPLESEGMRSGGVLALFKCEGKLKQARGAQGRLEPSC